jgi:hypothetical protein
LEGDAIDDLKDLGAIVVRLIGIGVLVRSIGALGDFDDVAGRGDFKGVL